MSGNELSFTLYDEHDNNISRAIINSRKLLNK